MLELLSKKEPKKTRIEKYEIDGGVLVVKDGTPREFRKDSWKIRVSSTTWLESEFGTVAHPGIRPNGLPGALRQTGLYDGPGVVEHILKHNPRLQARVVEYFQRLYQAALERQKLEEEARRAQAWRARRKRFIEERLQILVDGEPARIVFLGNGELAQEPVRCPRCGGAIKDRAGRLSEALASPESVQEASGMLFCCGCQELYGYEISLKED